MRRLTWTSVASWLERFELMRRICFWWAEWIGGGRAFSTLVRLRLLGTDVVLLLNFGGFRDTTVVVSCGCGVLVKRCELLAMACEAGGMILVIEISRDWWLGWITGGRAGQTGESEWAVGL